jgi:hypothetical protein
MVSKFVLTKSTPTTGFHVTEKVQCFLRPKRVLLLRITAQHCSLLSDAEKAPIDPAVCEAP